MSGGGTKLTCRGGLTMSALEGGTGMELKGGQVSFLHKTDIAVVSLNVRS